MRFLPILTFSLSFFFSVTASAAPASDGRKPSPLGSPLELAQWESDIAANSYAIRKSDKNLSSLVSAYEKVITHACMPNALQTLQHAGSPKDPVCLETIDRLLKVDAENPMAICARDGIDSKSCESAFAAQELEVYAPNTKLWPESEGAGADLELQIESSRSMGREEAIRLEAELGRAERLSKVSESERARYQPEIERLTQRLLWSACRYPKLKVLDPQNDPAKLQELERTAEYKKGVEGMSEEERQILFGSFPLDGSPGEPGQPSRAATPGPMAEVINALRPEKYRTTETVARAREDGVRRIRLVSTECNKAIERATKTLPNSPAIPCARKGGFAPECIRALRAERIRKARETPRSEQGKTEPQQPRDSRNFSTF